MTRVVLAAVLVMYASLCPIASAAAPLRLVTDQWVPYENLSDAADAIGQRLAYMTRTAARTTRVIQRLSVSHADPCRARRLDRW